jgi:hypothetical protein
MVQLCRRGEQLFDRCGHRRPAAGRDQHRITIAGGADQIHPGGFAGAQRLSGGLLVGGGGCRHRLPRHRVELVDDLARHL